MKSLSIPFSYHFDKVLDDKLPVIPNPKGEESPKSLPWEVLAHWKKRLEGFLSRYLSLGMTHHFQTYCSQRS
jgi:hypothetical protein